ncbi:MAG: sulfotransferase [Sphingorhabdus sp.]
MSPDLARAIELFKAGAVEEAIADLRDRISGNAGSDHFSALGQMLVIVRRKEEAARIFAEGAGRFPDNADLANSLANVLADLGRTDEALDIYAAAIERQPTNPLPQINLARLLMELKRHPEAVGYLESVLTEWPDHAEARFSLGYCMQQMGKFKAAEAAYLDVLAKVPDHLSALAELLSLPGATASTEHAAIAAKVATAVEANSLKTRTSPEAIKLLYALGKWHDRQNDYGQAHSCFILAKHIQRLQKGAWHPKPTQHKNPGSDAVDKASAKLLPCPIFIVGLPRSGTSLIEQMLASHARIFGGGETDFLASPIQASAELGSALGLAYLRKIASGVPEGKSHFTDKSLSNADHIFEIASLFPDAPIIAMQRDTRDIYTSCLSTGFGFTNDYTTSWQDFQQRSQQYRQDIDKLDGRAIKVCYEKLVKNAESELRRIIGQIRLDWDPGCLSYHHTDRVVRTESYWQVRQPLYHSSLGRWRNYAAQLSALDPIFKE